MGPSALPTAALGPRLATLGHSVVDTGDLRPPVRETRSPGRILALILRGNGEPHVSSDLDVCDPAIAPGVGTPVRGGLNYQEAHILMELVAESRRLHALDLIEGNPILDAHNMAAELAVELALSAFGQQII